MTKPLNIIRWILVLPVCLGIALLLSWFSTTVLKTQLDGTLVTGVKRTLIILTSTIITILVAGLIAPTHKLRASFAIAILWIMVVVMATGVALFGNTEYEILDGGVSLTSVLIGLVIGVIISWRVYSEDSEH